MKARVIVADRRAPGHEAAIGGAAYLRHRRVHRSRSHPRPRVLELLAAGGNGGAQESYTGLLLRLDRTKYDVRAVSLSAGSAVQRLRRLGVAVDVIDRPGDGEAVRELTGYLRRNEIDLVHAHMFVAEMLGTRAAVAAGTAVIMATVHSSRVRSAADVSALAAMTEQMDRLIVPSASIEAKVRGEGRHARFSIIANGVDLDRFSAPTGPCGLRQELGMPADGLLIGAVARLEAEKGHRFLIEAMPRVLEAVPRTWLAIVGDGSLVDALRAQAAALPASAADRIVFTGRREDVAALTADLDVAVLPSLREAQGISLLEAMARRRPVVASDVGGIPEVITHGRDGLLVPPRDPVRLADAIIALLTDSALRGRLGEAGYRTVVEGFSIDAQVRRTEAVYDEELARAGVIGSPGATASSPEPPDGRGALELPPP